MDPMDFIERIMEFGEIDERKSDERVQIIYSVVIKRERAKVGDCCSSFSLLRFGSVRFSSVQFGRSVISEQ